MRIFTSLIALAIGPLSAELLPPGGIDLVTTQTKLTGWAGHGGTVLKVPVTCQDFPDAMRVAVVTAAPDKPWSAQLTTPLTAGSVKNGDKLLVVYMARCVAGGSGRAIAKVQVSEPTTPMVGMTGTAKIGPEWGQVNQAFEAKADAPEGKGELVILPRRAGPDGGNRQGPRAELWPGHGSSKAPAAQGNLCRPRA